MTPNPPFSILARSFAGGPRPRNAALTLGLLWLAIFVASLFSPPLLDDADATHAQAARAMLRTGDLVTLHVDGIRYLEKAPLPYWLVALSFRLFGLNTFATHLPEAIAVALLALLGHRWANQAFGARTAFYTALATLTSAGVFLFTRIFIPEALLSLFLAAALFAFLKSLHPASTSLPTRATVPSEPPHHSSNRVPPGAPSLQSKGGVTKQSPPPASSPEPHPTSASLMGTASAMPSPTPTNAALAAEVRSLSPVPTDAPPERPAVAWYAGPYFYPYVFWASLACAVLTKGLIAVVFTLGTATLYLALTGDYRHLRRLKPLTGLLLFLAIAAPWHILAGLRNTGGEAGHGFFWFYFTNEHFLRFLGRRIPRDYNKLPNYLFWLQHLIWLFPWSLFLPLAGMTALKRHVTASNFSFINFKRSPLFRKGSFGEEPFRLQTAFLDFLALLTVVGLNFVGIGLVAQVAVILAAISFLIVGESRRRAGLLVPPLHNLTFAARTTLLLTLFTALILIFFSLSTNQEYYTFPAYLPILLLTCAAITRAEQTYAIDRTARRLIRSAHAALTLLGAAAAAALAYGLWDSRHLPFVPDIGDLLAHRGIGDYTLATSHLFDLTGPSFAALRLPAALALFAFTLGPAVAWTLRMQRRHIAATTAIALTSALFLIAAHIAFARFAPMLSSEDLAAKILELEDDNRISRDNQILIFGDQAFGSSIPFYLDRQVLLVDGRTTSLLFGSTFPDAPDLFLTSADLLQTWGKGPRKLLFVPAERRDEADRLLGSHQTLLEETSGKALLTDRPLDPLR